MVAETLTRSVEGFRRVLEACAEITMRRGPRDEFVFYIYKRSGSEDVDSRPARQPVRRSILTHRSHSALEPQAEAPTTPFSDTWLGQQRLHVPRPRLSGLQLLGYRVCRVFFILYSRRPAYESKIVHYSDSGDITHSRSFSFYPHTLLRARA